MNTFILLAIATPFIIAVIGGILMESKNYSYQDIGLGMIAAGACIMPLIYAIYGIIIGIMAI